MFLPTTQKELKLRGWESLDVILFTGDAYVDHPSFGAAVIGRVLEELGLKVGIVPQPNWRDDLRDFKKLGRPRLFFGVTAGNMDSMVNHYTANKRLRSDDAFTPDSRNDMRPDYPTVVYTQILKQLYPDSLVILGGIEASLRRVAHYDYWQDRLRPSILIDSGADLLVYGQGEKPITEIATILSSESNDYIATTKDLSKLKNTPQVSFLSLSAEEKGAIRLHSYSECLKDKRKQAENFKLVEEESNKWSAQTIIQQQDNRYAIIRPPYPTLTTEELDHVYDLPFERTPHPKYRGKTIPAFEMIKFSVNIHRGCFGGCSFCTISAHQGKFIASRSEKSILKELQTIALSPDFKGTISDLGGPSANMYKMAGIDNALCQKCKRSSCIFPSVCKNLNYDHAPMITLYQKAREIKGIKHVFIGSGVRYDLLLHRGNHEEWNKHSLEYTRQLIAHHVSGRLKVAPEHTSDRVLTIMRKPSFKLFKQFKEIFDAENQKAGLRQQIIPYFISSHPGCEEIDMAELALETKQLNFKLEQVQDFTPTPMTLSTEMFYTGVNPYTGEKIFVAKNQEDKRRQRNYFFWYDKSYTNEIKKSLLRLHRNDLLIRLLSKK